MGDASSGPATRPSLLIRIREAGNHEAWSLFVRIYTPLIHRYCCRRGMQEADACDVTQNVLRRVATQIRKFEYDSAVGRFRGWLATLTHHEIVRLVRKSARAGRGLGGDSGQEFLAELEANADPVWSEEFNAAIYEAAIERIRPEFSADQWQVFEQVWMKGRKPANVARELNKKPARVYKIKFNVLQRLKEEIEYLVSDPSCLEVKK
jgi:RNA polymerase sigma-70 factor, ECF subfamily